MVDVSRVDRRTGSDWPYTEKQMQQTAELQNSAQRDYPTAGRPVARRAAV